MMKPFALRKCVITVFVFLMVSLVTAGAQAATFQLDFTTDFSEGPITSISGTITYEADAINTAITSLTSIDLQIGDYEVALDNVGFISPLGSLSIIGGTSYGVGAVAVGYNDFWLRFYHFDGTPAAYDFLYGKSGETKNYQSLSFSKFSLTEVSDIPSVPEPASLLLFGLGLLGLAAARKKSRR